jgi:hypothetical protein
MTTAAEQALHEARALRLILAAIKEGEEGVLASQMVFNEINSIDDMEHVMGILAAYAAEEMTIADGPKKAARQVEKRLTFLLDFAARGTPS